VFSAGQVIAAAALVVLGLTTGVIVWRRSRRVRTMEASVQTAWAQLPHIDIAVVRACILCRVHGARPKKWARCTCSTQESSSSEVRQYLRELTPGYASPFGGDEVPEPRYSAFVGKLRRDRRRANPA